MGMTEEIVKVPLEENKKSKKSTDEADQRKVVIIAIVFVLLIFGGIIAAVAGLLNPNTPTERIRDIFIIFMAFESLVIGVALVILILQISTLINLLQHEIKPILDATNETVHTLRGTTAFLSENMAEPVIKLNASLAGLQRIFEIFGIKKS